LTISGLASVDKSPSSSPVNNLFKILRFDKRYNSYMYHLCVLGGSQEKAKIFKLNKALY